MGTSARNGSVSIGGLMAITGSSPPWRREERRPQTLPGIHDLRPCGQFSRRMPTTRRWCMGRRSGGQSAVARCFRGKIERQTLFPRSSNCAMSGTPPTWLSRRLAFSCPRCRLARAGLAVREYLPKGDKLAAPPPPRCAWSRGPYSFLGKPGGMRRSKTCCCTSTAAAKGMTIKLTC